VNASVFVGTSVVPARLIITCMPVVLAGTGVTLCSALPRDVV
jgi:hypothetical protein